jgi:hypothetical protein
MLCGKDGSFVREACRDRAVNHFFVGIVHQAAHACAKNRRKNRFTARMQRQSAIFVGFRLAKPDVNARQCLSVDVPFRSWRRAMRPCKNPKRYRSFFPLRPRSNWSRDQTLERAIVFLGSAHRIRAFLPLAHALHSSFACTATHWK